MKLRQIFLIASTFTLLSALASSPVAGEMTTIKSLAHFRNATDHAGLKGLQFYSNHNGFTLDDVRVTAAP